MDNKQSIQLFEDKRIRTAWDEEAEEWYFSIVDVIAVLTDSDNPQTYWRVMKKRLKDEGNETVINCNALKMTAADGKKCMTDVVDTEQLLRMTKAKKWQGAAAISRALRARNWKPSSASPSSQQRTRSILHG